MLERYSRLQVFSVHFGISLAIFLVLAGLMVTSWFPGPYFASDGGWQGIRIIAAVDMVLGPALTLIFFNPKKKRHKELLIDLVAIASVQLLALTWGTWTVYNQRTVAIAFSDFQFYSISHGALKEANAALRAEGITPADIDALSDARPRQIYVRPIPHDRIGRYLADVLNGLPEIQLRSDRYESLSANWEKIGNQALDIEEFASQQPDVRAGLDRLAQPPETLTFFRLKLRFGAALAAFDTETRELRQILAFKPVKKKKKQDAPG